MSKISRRGFVKTAALAPLAVAPFSIGQQASDEDRFDIVVAGAGHNSMIAAAYLAKAGYRCLLLEGRPIVGGGVKTAELTLKGFKDDVCSTAHTFLLDNPMIKNDELKLRDYGLEYVDPDPIFHIPFADGSYLTQWRDLDRTCAEFAKFSKKDAAAYRKMLAEFDAVKPILLGTSFTPIGFGKPLNDQLAQQPRGKLWQRRLAMSAWEIIRDTFEEEHCRTFMLYMSHLAAEPPDAPMTGRLAYGTARQQHSGRPFPKGGSGVLTQALARFIEAHNGVLLTNKWVKRAWNAVTELRIARERRWSRRFTSSIWWTWHRTSCGARTFSTAWIPGKRNMPCLSLITRLRSRRCLSAMAARSRRWKRASWFRRSGPCALRTTMPEAWSIWKIRRCRSFAAVLPIPRARPPGCTR